MKDPHGRLNIFNLLFQQAPNRVFLTIVLDALSGIAYAMLIPLVLGSISTGDGALQIESEQPQTFLGFEVLNHQYAALFVLAVFLILLTKGISQFLMERVAVSVTADLRMSMYRRLLQAPVAEVERVGPSRFMAILTEDVPWIIAGGRLFPTMLSNLATLAGMLGYLAYLNAQAFWFVVQALVVGSVTYQIPALIGLRFLRRKREFVDKLHHSVRALLDGFKELKLDRRKRETFLTGELTVNELGVRDASRAGDTILMLANIYGQLIHFFVIGIVAFVFVNYHAISNQELVAVIMTLLYITAPVAAVLQAIPGYMAAGVSLRNVNKLFFDIPVENAKPVFEAAAPWSTIRFENVAYTHPETEAGKSGYRIGPVSFEISRGECTFIIGGNGSGKSTLAKLITLHYTPDQGKIYFGNERISDETLNIYRQRIAFVYSDYYVFEKLLGVSDPEVKGEVDRYLCELGLEHKIKFENGQFSNLNLSDGQRRRLALLVAFIEDKDVYLFDEWAADQDPSFKDVFYYKILSDLKRKGKAVVVISHDDRYFEVADRTLFMENGRLIRDQDLEVIRRTRAARQPTQA